MVRPSTRSTLPRENLLTPGTTLMSPDLIFPGRRCPERGSRHTSMPELPQPTTRTRFPR
ncbi:unnamed protein product [Spirodela intermedia]|uniref:Uncharacterized protein n=1 Tax=Spirodela intermedia TaxID=51605 RepID=A0A7I8J8Y4_SPIIN|nr:unnamed protein product [Spirodela intermedia]CAA6666510.1 unnamed protein product [Spirodela intermedia]